ncbi:MAG: hypothetical protein E6G50_03365 [Actinobacteria bacterium]|nr:MAG: hypothetical protein E6G50_03365 [Actinomycetota bacterium]
MARTILSITAAPGWAAKAPDPDEIGEDSLFTLLAWALTEDDEGTRQVVGLVQRGSGDIAFADEAIEGFSGYSFQGLRVRPQA